MLHPTLGRELIQAINSLADAHRDVGRQIADGLLTVARSLDDVAAATGHVCTDGWHDDDQQPPPLH